MSAKQAINDKLQGSASAYLTCGAFVNTKWRKFFIAESDCEKIFKIGEYLAKLQAKMWA